MNLSPDTSPPTLMKNTPRPRSQSIREGDYVTDYRRLFRVLKIVPTRLKQRAAILEDCHTLDATLFRPKELKRMRLQLVQRSPAPSLH
jgi:hypothetical protein